MAKVINVDIKKLRELENGRILPDSEIIWKLYFEYNLPPAIMVKSKVDLINTIGVILKKLDVEIENFLLIYIRQCHEKCKSKTN